MGTFEYHNFSITGDPRWAKASRITRCAPLVVLTLFFLSVIQICLGAVWIVNLQKSMTVPKILQTLILPGLAFFNTLPSLHLHMLLRNNPPKLAIFFSGTLGLLYLTSCILWLVSCSHSIHVPQGLRETECARGSFGLKVGVPQGIWAVVVALGFISTILYAAHAGMAWYVMKQIEKEPKERQPGSTVDPDLALEARIRWARLARGEL